MRARRLSVLATTAPVLGLPGPALAHHVMDGVMPATWLEGLLSGLGHPVIGLDHLAFVIAVGLVSSLLPRGYLLPLAFLGGTLAGALMHLAGIGMPMAEALIALSVLVFGGLVALRRAIPAAAALALMALAGLAHGHAYAESIIGAEPAPLFAYFVGFLAVQYAMALAAWAAARRLAQRQWRYQPAALSAAGVLIGAVGAAALTLAVA